MANKKNKKSKKAQKKIKIAVKRKLQKKTVKKTTKKAAKKAVLKAAVKKTAAKKKSKSIKPSTNKSSKKVSPVKTQAVDYSQAITPLADRLVVRVLNAEKMTAGGLIIPSTASFVAGYLKAVVLAVGSGAKGKNGQLKPLDVKVGDHVLFAEYAGTKVNFNAEELQIIHESDVMGVVQN